MILETAVFTVRPTDHAAFAEAFARGRGFIETSPGFCRLEMRRGIEAPDTYVLVVWWQTLEDHAVGFKQSDNFTHWRAVIGHLFASPPVVNHYAEGITSITALPPSPTR